MIDMTYDDYLGDQFKMWFNDIDMSDYFIVIDVTGRSLSPNEITSVSVPAMPGAHMQRKRKKGVPLNVKVMIRTGSDDELRKRLDELNDLLDTEKEAPIRFSDEYDRLYYGVMSDISEGTEVGGNHIVTITFWRSSPFKYGSEIETDLTGQATLINVEGTQAAKPTFEFDVLAPITFAMVSNGDEYMMIGRPSEDMQTVVDTQVPILEEDGSTLSDWVTNGTSIDDWIGQIDGSMGYDGTGIYVDSYGDDSFDKLHGPARINELNTPIQDFQIESIFDVITDDDEENFRMEVYLFDENNNVLGKFGIHDNTRHMKRIRGLGRVGPYVDSNTGYVIGSGNYEKELGEVSLMFFRVKREGNDWTFYISEIQNGVHRHTLTNTYRTGDHQGPLKYVQIFIGKWQDRQRPFRARVNRLDVYELSQATEDETPYIAKEGDQIMFDHENEEILINGEDATYLKDFGASYFKVPTGEITLATLPNDLNGVMKYRPTYK